MRFVYVGQQVHIGRLVARGKLLPLVDHRFHAACPAIFGDQPRDLRPAQTRHPSEVAPHQSLVCPVQADVLVPHQCLLHPAVYFLPLLPGKPHLAAARQECPDLLQRLRF